jgi:hypothetical protein
VATTITALNDDESESPLQLISRTPDTAPAAADETEQSEYDRASTIGSVAPPDQRMYRITIPPHAELCLSLNFEPQAHGAVEFELPLELAGAPRCAVLRRLVRAEGLRARLGVSTTRVKMGNRIVRDPALPYRTSIDIFSQVRRHGILQNARKESTLDKITAANVKLAAGILRRRSLSVRPNVASRRARPSPR